MSLRPPMARPSSMPNASLEGVRILLLEDDDAVIGLLSTALSLRGASVFPARTPGELQNATEARTYDAALLDLSPIADDVGGALAKVRACCPSAKVVLISGSAAEVPAAAQGLMAAWVRNPSRRARSSRSCGICRAPEGENPRSFGKCLTSRERRLRCVAPTSRRWRNWQTH